MASIRDLKKRISSVNNTKQITRAMKMVSAAKLRRSQDAILSHRPYSMKIGELIRLTSAMVTRQGDDDVSPLIIGASGAPGMTKKRVLLIPVTSDRGLCGSFNASIVKGTQKWIEANRDQYAEIQMAFVGKKGFEFFKRREVASKYYQPFGNKANFDQAKTLVNWAVDYYLQGHCDEIKVVYNEFKNAITQIVQFETFLPVKAESVTGQSSGNTKNPDTYLSKPEPKELLQLLLKKHFAIQAYRILLESQASEHGARMSAMENATKNAGEMIKSLTLQYNKQRQAGITKELLEIIAGSESQKVQ